MHRYWLIGCLLLSAWCATAQITGVHAHDARLVYVGRTLVEGNQVSMDWTGSYVRVHFWGDYLAVRLSDSRKNYYNLYIDREPSDTPDAILTTQGDTTLVLYTTRKRPKEHWLTLCKRTEGEQGCTTFQEFLVQGEILDAAPLKPRQLEFIGDSYTCGYGIENCTMADHFSPETENSTLSYAAWLARYFDADYTLIAHSGMGIVRNYNSKFAGWYMPDRYEQTLDMDSASATKWNAASSPFRPQVTVILLGGNDFSVGKQPLYQDFETNYLRLLRQIKANYGAGHPIICCTKKGRDDIFAYVQQVVQHSGLQGVYYCPFFDGLYPDDERFIGADKHPNAAAHRKMAQVLIPYIESLTGWQPK